MTRDEYLAQLATEAEQAERYGATAPLGATLRSVIADVQALDGLPSTRKSPPRLLTLAEAAERLGVPKRWLTDHRRDLPFLRSLTPGGTVRVDEAALERWLAKR